MLFNPQTWAIEKACKDPAIVMSMSEESMREAGAYHRCNNTLLTIWIINLDTQLWNLQVDLMFQRLGWNWREREELELSDTVKEKIHNQINQRIGHE